MSNSSTFKQRLKVLRCLEWHYCREVMLVKHHINLCSTFWRKG